MKKNFSTNSNSQRKKTPPSAKQPIRDNIQSYKTEFVSYKAIETENSTNRPSERKTQNVIEFDNNPLIIILINSVDGKIINANPAACKYYGWTLSEFIAKNISDINMKLLENIISDEGKPDNQPAIPIIYKHRLANGEMRNVEVFSLPVKINNEQLCYLIVNDISIRKIAETKVAQKNIELENFFTSGLDLFCIASTEGYFIHLNRAWEISLGYKLSELEGKRFLDFVHPDDIASTLEAVSTLNNQIEVLNFINRYRAKDGSYKIIEWRSKPSDKLIYAAARDITLQKQREAEYYYEKALLRTLIDNIPDLIYAKDIYARKTLANKSDLGLMKVKSEAEVLGKDDFSFYDYDRAKEFYAEDRKVIENGEPAINTEGFHIDEEGRWRWFITSKYPLRDENGNIIGLAGIGRDITEHKLRELENERRLENAYKMQTAIVTLSSDPSVVHGDVNAVTRIIIERVVELLKVERVAVWLYNDQNTIARCIDVYEYSKHKHSEGIVIQKNIYPTFFNFVDIGHCIDISEAQIDQRTVELTESYLKPYDIHSLLEAPIRIEGQVIGIVSIEHVKEKRVWEPDEITFASEIANQVALAITNFRKRKAEQDLREYLERQESLIKLLQSEADTVQKFLDLTLDEAIKITGSTIGYIYHYNEEKKEFILNSWSKEVMKDCTIIEPQTVYQLESTGIWGEAVRQRKEIIVNDFEAFNLLKKGYPKGHVHLKKFLTIPFFQKDQIVAVVGVANKTTDYDQSDVTRLQLLMNSIWGKVCSIQSEMALREREKNLRQLNFTKDKLFSIISHDLRSPFHGFIALTEMMAQNVGRFTLDQLSFISKDMNKNAHRLFRLLKNLLDWSQLQRGTFEFNPGVYSLKEIINHNIETHSQKAAQKEITITAEISEPFNVNLDEIMISSVISNLLTNSIKFTKRGGEIIIGIRVIDNQMLECSIKDSGIGMSDELISRLFKLEEKVGREGTEGEESTSLGLIICKEFIEIHKGKIWAESKENCGTTFYFTLPMDNK